MQASNFVLADYFQRIGFASEPKTDIGTVAEIMRCQLFSTPFENLDVQAGKIISLVPEDIVEKIVTRRRGGYCYEVNGIFAMALQALGIDYQFVAARPMFYPTRRPRTHMAIVVNIAGEQWLCDLGFGSYGLRAPIRLDILDQAVKQDHDSFMLSKASEHEYLLQAWVDDVWAPQFAFDFSPQEWVDFFPANYMNSTHPDAIFVQKLLVVLHNPAGRKILFGTTLKTIIDGNIEKQFIAKENLANVLQSQFGLSQTS
ncbi:acetyltransferase [Methylovorus sp. MM2]|uniref:arylamine N-acetyltransferase family protein n=1 Tax=Methylovorus sp. MM2 TaxID=1848038 RepID=UPI0007DEBE24|nr:arylamine N-acetyltransferase [Methylovorus sp. MM2]OAM51825.1 acetyltransferase [Methylovorus sp. MM2]